MALTRAILIDNLIILIVYIYFVCISQKWALQVPPLLLDVSSRFSGELPFLESNALFLCARDLSLHALFRHVLSFIHNILHLFTYCLHVVMVIITIAYCFYVHVLFLLVFVYIFYYYYRDFYIVVKGTCFSYLS